MRMVIRSIPAAALALCLGTAHLSAQQPGNGNFQWYVGGQGGAMFFKTPTQSRSAIPTFGGHALIVAKRTGLLLSYEEGVGSNETSAFTSVSGVQGVQSATFNDIRKYSATLMAFPIRSAAQPYLGVGYGIIHVVNPRSAYSDFVANELGSSGFGSFIGGLQFQLGRFMAFGQYQITTSPSTHAVTDSDNQVVAFGRLLDGPTHTFTGGLRIGLGSARDNGATAGGY